MNPAQLLTHFDRINEAPDAIPRLRHFILDLAVRGKLFEQDPRDEPASELFKGIEAAKTRMMNKGKIRKQQSLPSLSPEEIPFEIPETWQWIRLGRLGFTQTGTTPSSNNPEYFGNYIPFVKPADLTGNTIEYSGDGISKPGIEHSRLIPNHSVLMVCIGSSIGKVNVTDREVCCNQQINTVTPYLEHLTMFTSFAMKAAFFQKLVRAKAGMGTLPIISKGKWETLPVPLPPLAEQHRIVAKVDELMALCDQLEAAQTERESRRDRLVASSLHHLNNGADPDAFREHARFYFNHLPRLTTRPNHIQQLRQTILNLAVRGKLVEQDPTDEPASEWLKRIELTRRHLLAEKKIQKPKDLPSIEDVELPFSVPIGWEWTFLGKLCYQVSDGPHHSPHYVSHNSGVPFLSTRNVRVDRFDLNDLKYVSKEDHERFCQRIRPEQGDILYTKGGTTGIARVNDLDFEFSVWVHLAVLRVAKEFLAPQYVALALNSPFCYDQSQTFTQGISNFDLGLTRMIKIVLPFPPLAEQHRIVAKVDELLALCDQLETQLTTTQSESRHLLEAVLHEAIAGKNEIKQGVFR